MKKEIIINRLTASAKCFLIILLIVYMASCEDEVKHLPVRSTDLQIAEYIATNQDMFSEFDGMVRKSQIRGLLNSHGPLTLLLPTNEALEEYYIEKGVNSYLDFDSVALNNLILNHIVPTLVETNNMVLGALPSVNAIGDYVVSEFQETDIIFNKRAIIIKRDISNLNGITHVIDRVLEPIDKSIYEVILADGGYTIFAKALEITGLKDTLNIISIPFGIKDVRNRFTILAVHDTVYNNRGINNIDGLIAEYSNGDDDLTNISNGFYQYVEYHCLANTYFLSDFGSSRKNYADLSAEKYVGIQATDDYKLNFDKETEAYTGFFIEAANIPSKNGVIHPINDLLPVVEPTPVPIIWEVTDHFDVVQEDFYRKRYARFTDGQNRFENIKWAGDFVLYYYKVPGVNAIAGDCWQMNGFFWIEVTTPKIPKGDYIISVGMLQAAESPNMVAYLDGERCDTLIMARDDQWQDVSIPFKTVHWKETKQHTLKLKTLQFGLMFWDEITFTPL